VRAGERHHVVGVQVLLLERGHELRQAGVGPREVSGRPGCARGVPPPERNCP
jgi:hypothetical protein